MDQLLYSYKILQAENWLQTPDTLSIIIFLILLLIIVFVFILGNLKSRKDRINIATRRQYNKFLFDRMAKDIGLEKYHVQILEKLIALANVKYPILLFSNTGLLDNILKKGIYSVERQSDIKERDRIDYLNTIYEIKQSIDRHSKKGIGLKSTFLIKPGQTFTFITLSGERFHSKLISNSSNSMTCSYPMVTIDKETLFSKGNRLKVFFWRENDSGYSFISKIIGFDKTKNIPCIYLQHSRKIKREQHRKFNRKPLKRSCFIYPVEIINEGTKSRPRRRIMIKERKRHLGIIFDISVGGCRIGSSMTIRKGAYIKLDFDIKPQTSIWSIGKVKSIKKRGNTGTTHSIHIQFVKLSSQNRNHIYSYVYSHI